MGRLYPALSCVPSHTWSEHCVSWVAFLAHRAIDDWPLQWLYSSWPIDVYSMSLVSFFSSNQCNKCGRAKKHKKRPQNSMFVPLRCVSFFSLPSEQNPADNEKHRINTHKPNEKNSFSLRAHVGDCIWSVQACCCRSCEPLTTLSVEEEKAITSPFWRWSSSAVVVLLPFDKNISFLRSLHIDPFLLSLYFPLFFLFPLVLLVLVSPRPLPCPSFDLSKQKTKLMLQEQSSSSSSNRFVEHDVFDPETRAFFGYTSKMRSNT